MVKNLPASEGDIGSVPRLRRSPGEGNGKCHGQRSLGCYSPWGCKRVGHDLVTKQQQRKRVSFTPHPSSIYFFVDFFDDRHSDQYEVIPHCSFDLHFSTNVGC